MPPLKIKSSGNEYNLNTKAPKTAMGSSRPRRNLDINKLRFNEHSSSPRLRKP